MSKDNAAMQITLLVTLVLHILSGVFWAGSTFALARTRAGGADQLFRPQMGAALVAVITGGLLWHLLHPSSLALRSRSWRWGRSQRSLPRVCRVHCAAARCADSQETVRRTRV